MNVHFIGIGGIGISALAGYYLKKGHKITGSDLASSEITKALKKKGAAIKIGVHQKQNLPKDTDLVIYSAAIRDNNPELLKAKSCQLKAQSYPQALGDLTKKHFTIAVCGTHGKSTTSAMIGLLLVKAGFDPTVIIGTKLREFGDSNCRVGRSQYLVIEADEHFASFLNYWPKIIVLTNIDKEHLDYYKNLSNVKKSFKKFIRHLPKDGELISGKSIHQADIGRLSKLLKIPGEHNFYNAALALNTARAVKISDKISFKALSEYRGSWRRFEERAFKLKEKHINFVSDYAHHPTEIKVTLKAAKQKWPKKEIWCIFQPHQYQRTYYLFKDFVRVLKKAPVARLIITDIYDVAGRENKKLKNKVSSKKLVAAIGRDNAIYLPKDKIFSYLKENLKNGKIGVLIIMGAGDIYNLSLKFIDIFK